MNSPILQCSGWSIGRVILDRRGQAGRSDRIIDRLAADLRAAFPGHRGLSVRHLHYTRAVAAAWPTESEFLQTPAAELTWSHVDDAAHGFDDPSLRGSSWAAAQADTERLNLRWTAAGST